MWQRHPGIPGLIKRRYRCQNQNEIQRLHDVNPPCFSAPPCQHLGKSVYNITAEILRIPHVLVTPETLQLSRWIVHAWADCLNSAGGCDWDRVVFVCVGLTSRHTTMYTYTHTHTVEIPAQITDMTVTDTDIVKDKLTNPHSTCFLPIQGGMETAPCPLPLVKPSSGATGLI